MSRQSADELESLREDGVSARDATRAPGIRARHREWDRAHPTGLAAILDWIEQLRAVFGDPPVDRRPWRGSDFRL